MRIINEINEAVHGGKYVKGGKQTPGPVKIKAARVKRNDEMADMVAKLAEMEERLAMVAPRP